MNQLRFVPASTFTGSVDHPLCGTTTAAAPPLRVGQFSMGVVNSVKKLQRRDLLHLVLQVRHGALRRQHHRRLQPTAPSSPKNTVTYGAALKLIMLAAGYPEQDPP